MDGIPDCQRLEFVQNVNPLIGIGKKCTRCGQVKDLNEYFKRATAKDNRQSECKKCHTKINLAWQKANPKKKAATAKKYYINHPNRVIKRAVDWKKANPEKSRAAYNKNYNKKKNFPDEKLNNSMSGGMYCSLKGLKKGARWQSLVDFTFEELKVHLEKHFTRGMSWENYGKRGWHIDHKIPVTAFNFEKPTDIDFKRCWALKNLQPMWESDNIRKSNKLYQPFQPALIF
jgi:hypothetical protein